MNKRIVKTLMIVSLSISGLLLVLNLQSVTIALATIGNEPKVNDSTFQVMKSNAEKELTSLDKKLKANMPETNYLVVNSTMNEFYLYKGDELIKKDMCSTGSYVLLKKSEKEKWMFKTPKGEFRILNKTKDPVWKKPDWAFVEEGLPVPSYNHPSRFEYGVLGDYSLSLGDGYLIHGTLFQRFLGLPVTHGCIRLNDENLELVYKSMPMGAKVYIF
ncbi:L,D-transpeptidase [Roseivirga spongicola]|uniref:L,D-transpeptidase n=1 Tax=Roseivirga spongicola TaxID=333140 RepID=UPI002AC92E50|nr:L,D-transpeptidase [Roseivirga spongicola]WPZ10210.1 L,D-transpeptidase [Roseivirga spongicola]